ncbi:MULTISPECIES: hypothetical protein [unclassified Chelatococcus]|uniref:hypothetical protein n=1 Tax=unclassified Chelatococcus TaxID=2638111 RepID=UPI001BCE2633|nr:MULTISPECIES: hypothetical protein [unclassified Chelatococcus]CAH1661652.1 conserved exported hypothetical protein [Hyphomicrobiales bacterium]MBS7741289.1 hypothetical protein [Chelatococcus sp. HY11]MBX3546229.1 hypothetical protein [Chelatococcus sp.]MCO5078112.1 hypothetical protein [Chelatococcus sp.]CAH1683028.1 conserved exported hypothetical protein [Hyphomicrobiales bacterium]
MMRQSVVTVLLAFVLAAFASTVRAADPVFPTGLNIGLVPPGEMREAKNFLGFEDEASGSAILMTELPTDAYSRVVEGLKVGEMEKQGLSGIKREDWTLGGAKAVFVSARQQAGAHVINKWVVVASSPLGTAVVTVQVPESTSSTYNDEIVRAALKSLVFRKPPPMEEQIAALPFSLGKQAGFRVSRVLAGTGLLMTEGPKDSIKGAEQPIVIVASGDGAIPGTLDQDRFARQAFGGLASIVAPEIKTARNLTLQNVPWHEITAVAQDSETKDKVFVMQAIRFDTTRYIRLIAMSRERDQKKMLARFETIRDSIAPKPENSKD